MSQVAISEAAIEARTNSAVFQHTSGGCYYAATSSEVCSFECRSPFGYEYASDTSIFRAIFGAATISTGEDIERFRILRDSWRRERGITSSTNEMAMCPSYQKIIGMGGKAVPMIIRELEVDGDDPDHWFWALEMITGADPVPVESYGDSLGMAKAWLSWAKERYG